MKTIRIHVKYFSFFQNITGRTDEHIHLKESNAGGLIKLLKKKYSFPSGNTPFGRKSSNGKLESMIIVNGKVVNLDYPLKDNDNVSLLPPMGRG